MSTAENAIGAGSATPPATIKVWDPFVRTFHWSLATLFLAAYVTGDDAGRLHIAAGYGIALLIAVRVAWGFVGSRNARFGNFVRSPRTVVTYLRDVALFRAPRYLGHNPAGARHDRRASGHALRHRHHRLHDDDERILGREVGRRDPRSLR